jgi:hypothetical protein
MSPPLDSSPPEKSARRRTDTATTPSAFRWTHGSNPASSSGESGANLIFEPETTRLCGRPHCDLSKQIGEQNHKLGRIVTVGLRRADRGDVSRYQRSSVGATFRPGHCLLALL